MPYGCHAVHFIGQCLYPSIKNVLQEKNKKDVLYERETSVANIIKKF